MRRAAVTAEALGGDPQRIRVAISGVSGDEWALGGVPVALAVAGGIAYSLGVVFFPWKSIRHHHAIFHLFVMAGSIFHYLAVVLYVVPQAANL